MAFEMRARPLAKCIKCTGHRSLTLPIRSFTSAARLALDVDTGATETQAPPPSTPKKRDPNTVTTAHGERQLLRNQRLMPIGSRRRRAAMQQSGLPFSELPYQCFQEAREYLREDRAEKLEAIRIERERIEKLKQAKVSETEQSRKEIRLQSMQRQLEELKILADINDPLVKKTFEDGKGDMNKPIYRYLADRKWRSYKRRVLIQRITQMNVVPDVLPSIEPVVSTSLSFAGRKVAHGEFVDSLISAQAPKLNIQCYDKGKRLVTIAVINPDVPDVSKDGFGYRCHFLACNIEISPTDTQVNLSKLVEDKQVVLPWLPAYAQKGLPYQRMSVVILNQSGPGETETRPIDITTIQASDKKRDGFILRSFVNRMKLTPVGVDLFRTKWDDGTAEVMQNAGIPGWDVEFRAKRIEPLPYQRKDGERYR